MRIFSFYTNQSSPFENGGAIYCTFFNSATVARITYTLKSCVLFHLECHLMEAIGSRQQVEKRIGTEFGEWRIASQTTTIATIKTARTWFIRSASAPENASVPLLFGWVPWNLRRSLNFWEMGKPWKLLVLISWLWSLKQVTENEAHLCSCVDGGTCALHRWFAGRRKGFYINHHNS